MSLDNSPSSNLIVPVVLWGRHAPSHKICSLYVTPDRRTLVTGCSDGHIITWKIDPATFQPTPYMMLVGHTARVVCLSDGLINTSHKYLVSAADNGELCTWDLQEGQCIETNKMVYIHRQIQAYQPSTASTVTSSPPGAGTNNNNNNSHNNSNTISGSSSSNYSDVLLFCCGEYADVAVIHPLTLQLLRWLSSRFSSNWIASLHVFKPTTVSEDVVMGVTMDGVVKIWLIECVSSDEHGTGPSAAATGSNTGSESGDVTSDRQNAPIMQHYEDESKRIQCDDVCFLRCCAYNQRTVLVVSSNVWQVYDACDFSLLCWMNCEDGDSWLRGEFMSPSQLVLWSESGKASVYQLPFNDASTQVHLDGSSNRSDHPSLQLILHNSTEKQLYETPCTAVFSVSDECGLSPCRLLIRGDCTGQLLIWKLPSGPLQIPTSAQTQVLGPSLVCSLASAWNSGSQPPVGVFDHLEETAQTTSISGADGDVDTEVPTAPRLTCSLYVPLRSGHLVCGREDGSVVIMPATQTVALQLLSGKHQLRERWPVCQLLCGHQSAVTALLYPYTPPPAPAAPGTGGAGGGMLAAPASVRYRACELITGGQDFSVCLWDLFSGSLLHRFVVQAGVITQLLVPPENVSSRVQQCVCSVAADHSVALFSLKDRRCLMLAGRHVFPVVCVKWRPLHDFMVVETEDGSVSVWQIETGHLDRVVHGATAQDMLSACDEYTVGSMTEAGAMANPAVHLFRGLRHRNMAAIRHAAKRGLQQLQHPQAAMHGDEALHKERTNPLLIQGLRTNADDSDSHVLFFDVESLIDFLGRMKHKAGDVEKRLKEKDTHGYLNRMKELKEQSGTIREQLKEKAEGSEDLKKLRSRAQQAKSKLEQRIHKELDDKPDAAGLLARVKEGAETVGGMINAKTLKMDSDKQNGEADESRATADDRSASDHVIEVCRILLSLVHSWGVDPDLDKLCETRLGLLRPKVPVCFGLISKNGFMSLLLPSFVAATEPSLSQMAPLEQARMFTRRLHWRLSCALSTNHLLTLIALANTLMSINNNSLMSETDRHRKLHRQLTRALSSVSSQSVVNGTTRSVTPHDMSEVQNHFWSQVKETWSRLAALHCVQFPERMEAAGVVMLKPLPEILAIKWQDRCIEIRQAAQALLLAELRRLSPRALKSVVDSWASLLPSGGDHQHLVTPTATASGQPPASSTSGSAQDSPSTADSIAEDFVQDHIEEEAARRAAASAAEARRKQATAIILLGVIGAEFGHDVSSSQHETASTVDGFGLGPLALHTSQALAHLLLTPPSSRLPAYTPLRRAAIDLIGRGFTQWEPHVDASRVLLAMLELCCEAHPLAPSMSYGLPLSPAADTARTARHAVSLIARARPQVFITTMAREVARYNSLQQNAQPLNVVIHHTVLVRARAEILRVLQQLVESNHNPLLSFLIELCDILLHCLDSSHIRQRPLSEVFPAIGRFNQISHCISSRRLAVGTVSGSLAIYDLRQNNKTQLSAHSKAVSACSFSPDGKFLASYSSGDSKISFWQTSTGMFGLGHAQTRCIKTYSTPPINSGATANRQQQQQHPHPTRQPRLVWIGHRTVTALMPDSTEHRYCV